MAMELETYPFISAQPLTEAYVHRTDAHVEDLFGYHAGVEEDWNKRLKRLESSASLRASAAEVGSVLRAYNERFSQEASMLASLTAFENGSPVVIGGQQAGLWTGPLLVIHKAVSIIQAARSASEQLGCPVVPVFWIAGEDHDWDEANHTYVPTAEQELRKLTVARPGEARTSVSRTKLSEETLQQLLEDLEQALPHSEFKPVLLEKLRLMALSSHSLSELFAHILSYLFAKEGLILVDADDPQLRIVEGPMFRRLIERNDDLEQAYIAASSQVKELGYAAQAEVSAGSANLFVFRTDREEERMLLYKTDGRFHDRKETAEWTKHQLLQLADEQPHLLSNNVLTRPLMQDYVFPVLAAVLGHGEIAYWALTGEAFRTLEMEMPIIVPRMSYTLVEGIIAKNMAKYELSFADVMERFDELKEAWLKRQDDLALETKFGEVKQTFEQMYTPLLELATSIQPGLSKLGEMNLNKIIEQISYMETKTTDAYMKQFEASTRQMERIRLSIKPNGKTQERVVSMLAYWNRYGESWLEKIMESPYNRVGEHHIIYL